MSRLSGWLFIGLSLSWRVAAGAGQKKDPLSELSKTFEIPGATTYMVAMRDGTRLATDVILPRGKPEANELTAILITCVNNAKRRRNQETK
jgi:predicted acyl esterase